MKKKLTSVLLFLALSAGVVSAQTSKVTGKVIGGRWRAGDRCLYYRKRDNRGNSHGF